MSPANNFPLERLPLEDMLAQVDTFREASPLTRSILAQGVVRLQKGARSVVLEAGQSSDGLYILLRGRINLLRTSDGSKDLILCSLGAGSVFGESCAVEGMKVTANAVTAIPSLLARISKEALNTQLLRDPRLMPALMRLLGQRLSEVESVASGLALCDVEERLRQTLIRLAKRQGRSSGAGGDWVLAPMPTQSELARMVGSCRETVSRTLTAMARSGLLSSSGRRMVLADSFVSGAMA